VGDESGAVTSGASVTVKNMWMDVSRNTMQSRQRHRPEHRLWRDRSERPSESHSGIQRAARRRQPAAVPIWREASLLNRATHSYRNRPCAHAHHEQ
jgi:hypothetical protein